MQGRMWGKRGLGRPGIEMLGVLFVKKHVWSNEKMDRRSVGIENLDSMDLTYCRILDDGKDSIAKKLFITNNRILLVV